MNPQDQQNPQTSLNRSQQQADPNNAQTNNTPVQQSSSDNQPQQKLPYAAFPATMKRDYDPGIRAMIADLVDRKYGGQLSNDVREFEIARVYNKLEIDIFELSTWQLPQDKQDELQKMTEQSQSAGGNQQELILKIREYMQTNVPDITNQVIDYMQGFANQYMAGRY